MLFTKIIRENRFRVVYLLTPWRTIPAERPPLVGKVSANFASSYSVQNLSVSRLLSKIVKIKIHKSTLLPLVLYGCETRSLTLKEGLDLKVIMDRLLKRKVNPKEMK
jgi:hypothetical protein